MAVSLNDIKNKIASTKNTSQITNAMQMVSAAKLGKSEEAAKNFQIYASKVRKLLTDLLHGHEAQNSNTILCLLVVRLRKRLISLSHRIVAW